MTLPFGSALGRAAIVLLLAAACVSVAQGLRNAVRPEGSQDNQWGPSRALLRHVDPYAAFLDSQGGPPPFILCQIPTYPASGLVFLWPYAPWAWPTARALWAWSNIVFTAVILLCILRLLPRETPQGAKWLLLALFLVGTPWRNTVGNGQHTLFTLAFFLLAVVLSRSSPIGAGLSLSASWLKYTVAFPLSLHFTRSRHGRRAVP
jgi:hypothetical protein